MKNKEKKHKFNIYSKSQNGHRKEYIKFALSTFNCEQTRLPLLSKRPVLYLMIEENFIAYAATAILRNLFGKRTTGLLFRPKEVISEKTIKLKIKKKCLAIMKKLKNINNITIVPFKYLPGIEKIADGWIYDFQLWDIESHKNRPEDARLKLNDSIKYTEMYRSIKDQAKGKKILVALGRQNTEKGFQKLIELLHKEKNNNNWHIFIGGQIDASLKKYEKIATSIGAQIINRNLAECEMMAAYRASDAIWCAYHPSYDQASGIFGRAIQLNRMVIVRRNSISAEFCTDQKIPKFEINYLGDQRLHLDAIKNEKMMENKMLIRQFRDHSMSIIEKSMKEKI